MEKLAIETKRRWDLGKNGSRRLRKEGWIPAVVYGSNEESIPIAIERKNMDMLLHTEGGRNNVYLLMLDKDNQKDVLIRDFQLDPIRDELLHVDFISISKDRLVEVNVPIVTSGEPIGVKDFGGIMVILRRDVPVQCLPQDIPPSLTVDVSDLHINDQLKIKDIPVSEKIEILLEPDINVVSVEYTRATVSLEEEEEVVEEEVEEAEETGEEKEI